MMNQAGGTQGGERSWVRQWKVRLNPWVRPLLNRISPYHRAFARQFPAQLPPARPVVVVGNLYCANGVGEVARGSLRALRAVGHTTAFVDIPCHQPLPQSDWPEQTPLPAGRRVNLVHMNAKDTRWAYRTVGSSFFAGHVNVGYWFWEQTKFPPSSYHSFGPYAEIWVGSRFCQSVLAEISPVPVVWMRPLIAPDDPPPLTRAELGLPEDRFIFYFSFDLMSVLERKNPLALIDAYRRAFGLNSDSTALVIKVQNVEMAAAAGAQVGFEPAEYGRMVEALQAVGGTLLDSTLSRPRTNALLAACDCYVSLHRSEGFGLSIAEAMYYGKPTIATAYSAPTDFLTPSNSIPVGYGLVELERDISVYAAGTQWAEPDVEQAAAAMQQVVNNPERARALGEQAAQDIRRDYSAEVVGQAMLNRIRLAVHQQGMRG